MAYFRKRGMNWFYTVTDANGRTVERKGCSDRKATEQMARDAETAAARNRSGAIDPKTERIQACSRAPIGEHVQAYVESLRVGGRCNQHVEQTTAYVKQVLELGGIGRLADLTPSRVVEALAKLKETGASSRTVEARATAAKSFSRWAWRDGRTADYDLKGLSFAKDPGDRRLTRRVLTPEELARLVATTRTAPPWRGVSGVDRSMLYALASMTGFRRNELRSLTPESFDLDGDPPRVVCKAAYTKNGKLAEQPLPTSMVPTLKEWLATKAPGTAVFATVNNLTAMMLRQDLARIGIDPKTASGNIDLHALRHTYITALAKSGVPVKVLQALARHSDPKLTMNTYAHVGIFDTGSAVQALGDPFQPPATVAAKATGTEGGIGRFNGSRSDLADYLPNRETGTCRIPTSSHGESGDGTGSGDGHKSLGIKGFAGSYRIVPQGVGRVRDGIRTRDFQIHNLVP